MIILKDFEKELLNELRRWLPKMMIDSHMHCQSNFANKKNAFAQVAKSPSDTFAYFTWSEHQKILAELLPYFRRRCLIFAFPLSCQETIGNNYVRVIANKQPNVNAVFVATGEANNFAMIKNAMSSNAGFKGLKIKIRKDEKKVTSIMDFCSPNVLELLNRKKSFVIIHLPVNLDYSKDELRFLSTRYSDTAFIIAHMGNNYIYQNDLDSVFSKMVGLRNVFFDTAMIIDAKVLTSAISILGYQKIFYGSDAPFSYLRGEFNYVGSRVVFDPEIFFPWVDKQRYQSYCHKSSDFTMVHLQNLAVIKEVVDNICSDKNQAKLSIFSQNILSAKII